MPRNVPEILLGDLQIQYQIIYSKRKTIGIILDKKGLLVRAPKRVSKREITELLTKKEGWIRKSINKINAIQAIPEPIIFRDGELVRYLGNLYPIRIVAETRRSTFVKFVDDEFVIHVPNGVSINQDLIQRKMILWYREEAATVFSDRIDYYSGIIGAKPDSIRIRGFKRRWGACHSNGLIEFNWRLVLAPMEIVDYLVVHEMAHLITTGHSPRFRRILGDIIPDFKQREKWLRNYGPTLTI